MALPMNNYGPCSPFGGALYCWGPPLHLPLARHPIWVTPSRPGQHVVGPSPFIPVAKAPSPCATAPLLFTEKRTEIYTPKAKDVIVSRPLRGGTKNMGGNASFLEHEFNASFIEFIRENMDEHDLVTNLAERSDKLVDLVEQWTINGGRFLMETDDMNGNTHFVVAKDKSWVVVDYASRQLHKELKKLKLDTKDSSNLRDSAANDGTGVAYSTSLSKVQEPVANDLLTTPGSNAGNRTIVTKDNRQNASWGTSTMAAPLVARPVTIPEMGKFANEEGFGLTVVADDASEMNTNSVEQGKVSPAEGSGSVSAPRKEGSPFQNSPERNEICAISNLTTTLRVDESSDMPACSSPEGECFVTESSSPATLEEECQVKGTGADDEHNSPPEQDSTMQPQQEDSLRSHISYACASDDAQENSDAVSDDDSSVDSVPCKNRELSSERTPYVQQSKYISDKTDKSEVSVQAPQQESRPTRKSKKMRPNLLLLRLYFLSQQNELPAKTIETRSDPSHHHILVQSLASDVDCNQEPNDDDCSQDKSSENLVSCQDDEEEVEEGKGSTRHPMNNTDSVSDEGCTENEDLISREKCEIALPLPSQDNNRIRLPRILNNQNQATGLPPKILFYEKSEHLVASIGMRLPSFFREGVDQHASDRFLYLSRKKKTATRKLPSTSSAPSTHKQAQDVRGSRHESDRNVSSDWTEEEDKILREKCAIFPPLTCKEISQCLQPRTEGAVSSRISKMKIPRKTKGVASKSRQDESFIGTGGEDKNDAFSTAKASPPREKRALGGLTWDDIVSNSLPKMQRGATIQSDRTTDDGVENEIVAEKSDARPSRNKLRPAATREVGGIAADIPFSTKRQRTLLRTKRRFDSIGNGNVPSVKNRISVDWTDEEDRILKALATSVPRLSKKELALRLHPRTSGSSLWSNEQTQYN